MGPEAEKKEVAEIEITVEMEENKKKKRLEQEVILKEIVDNIANEVEKQLKVFLDQGQDFTAIDKKSFMLQIPAIYSGFVELRNINRNTEIGIITQMYYKMTHPSPPNIDDIVDRMEKMWHKFKDECEKEEEEKKKEKEEKEDETRL